MVGNLIKVQSISQTKLHKNIFKQNCKNQLIYIYEKLNIHTSIIFLYDIKGTNFIKINV